MKTSILGLRLILKFDRHLKKFNPEPYFFILIVITVTLELFLGIFRKLSRERFSINSIFCYFACINNCQFPLFLKRIIFFSLRCLKLFYLHIMTTSKFFYLKNRIFFARWDITSLGAIICCFSGHGQTSYHLPRDFEYFRK